MKKSLIAKLFGVAVFGAALPSQAAETNKVLKNYSDIAHAMYSDALATATTLHGAIEKLIARPSDKTLRAAKAAWLAARVPYQQTEGFRFGNPDVDDWEGKVNAWPLDEGLIDYVDPSYGTSSDDNPYYTVNVVANARFKLSGKEIDATKITPALLSNELHELDGVEANVATGYHAIEFLLWGQDLNGTEPGAGTRPHTDFDPKNCSHGNCDRRAAYLKASSDLLLSDLKDAVALWAPGGPARERVTKNASVGVTSIVKGLGSLSYGELAGERMKLGLLLHDPEEEHDCFADNTHNSHYYNQVGMMAIYTGTYVRADGSVHKGPGLRSLVTAKSSALATRIDDSMAAALAKLGDIKAAADQGLMSYDQMLAKGNKKGNKLVQDAVDALIAQARALEEVFKPLGIAQIAFEGSDSLDSPGDVFK